MAARTSLEAKMFCPRCRQEYQPGLTACPACGEALVTALPIPELDDVEWVDLVTVLKTGDEAQLQVAQSLLAAEGIPCVVGNRRGQDLFGIGRTPGAFNLVCGPAELQVRAQDAAAARELLAANDLAFPEPEDSPAGDDPPEP